VDYDKLKATADRLLQAGGMLITLSRYENIIGWAKSYDEVEMCDKWTNSTTGEIAYTAPTGAPTEYKFYGVRTQFSNYETDGNLIQRGDVKLVLSTDFPVPAEGDKFTVDDTVYNYVNHEEKSPAGIAVTYIVQVRK